MPELLITKREYVFLAMKFQMSQYSIVKSQI